MAIAYTHGAYGVMAKTISHIADIGSTVAVYVGTAPVNLIRGYDAYVNTPIKLTSMSDVLAYCGYSAAWDKFTLCEAFKLHFDNPDGNIGPIVAINVMDPVAHGKTEQTTAELSVVNGHASIVSDTIILDTLKISGKVEGTDYTVSYDHTVGRVELVFSDGSTEKLQATYMPLLQSPKLPLQLCRVVITLMEVIPKCTRPLRNCGPLSLSWWRRSKPPLSTPSGSASRASTRSRA